MRAGWECGRFGVSQYYFCSAMCSSPTRLCNIRPGLSDQYRYIVPEGSLDSAFGGRWAHVQWVDGVGAGGEDVPSLVVVHTARPHFLKNGLILSHRNPTAKAKKRFGLISVSQMRCDFESEPTWNHFFRRRHDFDSSNYLFP